MRLSLATAVALAFISLNCSGGSSTVETKQLLPSMSAASNGATTYFRAELRDMRSPNDYRAYKLADGEKLTVSSGSQTIELVEEDTGAAVLYTKTENGTFSGASLTFALDRAEGAADAPSSQVTMPAEFSITAPAADGLIKRSEAVTVTWSPSGTATRTVLTIESGCNQYYMKTIDGDPGTYTIAVGDLLQSASIGSVCDGTLEISRQAIGTTDPAFHSPDGGPDLKGIQYLKIAIRVES